MKTLRIASLKKLLMLLLILISGLATYAMFARWKVKQPYEVRFKGGKISGRFESLRADIRFDKAHPEGAKISASIAAASIATGFFIKNNHAKDALEAEKYPTISFTSTKVSRHGNAFEAVGNLTMKGVTKPVTIHFTFDDNGAGGVFKGGFTVRPRSFNITRNGSPEQLAIMLVVPVSRG
ncbi:YceI family protein [Mucilaginibacter mali]|uniref:YceI family protein n=1 Tax=Mucilaginibacter mali TaxID=2740462 RepID=A0A7D4TY02_9SPHI|nr:YceI family protein [Mucilaginibacter mali]QKJ30857.1 YceI family protein [Mucilaginibacter mali]